MIRFNLGEYILILLLLFLLFAPSTILFNSIIIVLTTLLFVTNGTLIDNQQSFNLAKIFLSALLVIGVLFNLPDLSQVDLARSIVLTILVLFSPIKIKLGKVVMSMLPILIATLIITQILIAIGEPLVTNLRAQFYPIEDNVWRTSEQLNISELLSIRGSQRFGGLYYNPNIMGQMITFVSCLSLFFWKKYSSLTKVLIITSTFLAILISGSRTALAAAIPIFLFGTGALKLLTRNVVKVTVLGIASIAILLLSNPKIPEFRAANFSSGISEEQGSLFIKTNILVNYLDQNLYSIEDRTFELAFGYGYPTIHMDFDIGYIINIYGFMGILLITLFLYLLFKRTPLRNRYIYFLLLIAIGATVIINFRFSILFFLIAGINNYRHENSLVRPTV